MVRPFLVLGMLLCLQSLHAQSLSPHVVATSGKSFSSTTAQLDFTLGEAFTSTYFSTSHALSQGFHQPEIIITTVEHSEHEFAFSLYPNPTAQFVTVESTLATELQVSILDIQGRQVQASSAFTRSIILDLHSLMSGNYFIAISNAAGKPIISYSLIKTDK